MHTHISKLTPIAVFHAVLLGVLLALSIGVWWLAWIAPGVLEQQLPGIERTNDAPSNNRH